MIRAFIFSLAITKPLTRPQRTPSNNFAATPIYRLLVRLITTAVVTLAQAITEATERLKLLEARQNNMLQATIFDMEIARLNFFILMKVAKFGTKMAQAIKSTANTTSMLY